MRRLGKAVVGVARKSRFFVTTDGGRCRPGGIVLNTGSVLCNGSPAGLSPPDEPRVDPRVSEAQAAFEPLEVSPPTPKAGHD